MMSAEGERFLSRIRHDLVKRMLWAARDRMEMGGTVVPGELVAVILDDEGAPVGAVERFAQLCDEAGPIADRARERFARALADAEAAARADDLSGVLALQTAFDELAQDVKRGTDNA